MAEAKKPASKKARRSPRREIALPIRVFGTTLKGRDFTENCVCVRISRHGAQIRTKHMLVPNDVVHVTNLRNNKEATFRVIAQITNPPGVPYCDWGLEALDTNDIWD